MAKESEDKESRIQELLTRGVEDVIERPHLESALRSGRKLRVKLGIDPTAANLHLGHAVVLGKLRQFQELGHKAVLIIGDFTATIGDPSGRVEAREPLTAAQVKENMRKYLLQAGKVIDLKHVEVRRNSEWHVKKGLAAILELASVATVQQVLKRQDFAAILELASVATVQQVLKRQDFAARISEDRDITLMETLYPLLQGYDSVAVRSDVELGGTDQLLNVLMGRKVQRHYKIPEQDILTVSLMEGLDGSKKMSKSVGNTVNLLDSPEDMFGKTMSLPDALIVRWLTLATDVPLEKVAEYEHRLKEGINPKIIKGDLAARIVRRYYGDKAAVNSAQEWENVFSKKDLSAAEFPEIKLPKSAGTMMVVMTSGVVTSKGEARRLIEQGAVSVDGKVQKDWNAKINFSGGEIVKIGKRHFFKVKI